MKLYVCVCVKKWGIDNFLLKLLSHVHKEKFYYQINGLLVFIALLIWYYDMSSKIFSFSFTSWDSQMNVIYRTMFTKVLSYRTTNFIHTVQNVWFIQVSIFSNLTRDIVHIYLNLNHTVILISIAFETRYLSSWAKVYYTKYKNYGNWRYKYCMMTRVASNIHVHYVNLSNINRTKTRHKHRLLLVFVLLWGGCCIMIMVDIIY